jgi:hypothetical protein
MGSEDGGGGAGGTEVERVVVDVVRLLLWLGGRLVFVV